MKIIKVLKKIRDHYVQQQVDNIQFPVFATGNVIRKKYIFTGKVQHVGFRKEVDLIAKKMGLTGWIKNNENGKVEAEIQGETSKLDFLIRFMTSLKRIKIAHIEEKMMPIREEEKGFSII